MAEDGGGGGGGVGGGGGWGGEGKRLSAALSRSALEPVKESALPKRSSSLSLELVSAFCFLR